MDELLTKWEESLGQTRLEQISCNQSRRRFLQDTLRATALTLLPGIGMISACSQERTSSQQDLNTTEPWATFAAVQQILFPDDGNGPDAVSINATYYLKFVLDTPDMDPDDREFIHGGISWLNDLSRKQYQNDFRQCDQTQQEDLVKQIAASDAGERWLSYLLLYIFEALLTDPVYGGNPAGIGWQWLQHQPGFPAPPANKRYLDLL